MKYPGHLRLGLVASSGAFAVPEACLELDPALSKDAQTAIPTGSESLALRPCGFGRGFVVADFDLTPYVQEIRATASLGV